MSAKRGQYRGAWKEVKKAGKNRKKVLTRKGSSGNIIKRFAAGHWGPAVRGGRLAGSGGWENKKGWKTWKKFLTKRTERGILIKSLARAARITSKEQRMKELWKVWKNLKKFLTKRKRCVIIKTRCGTETWAARCAPCKLNNVTNTKHQKGDGCFKRALKEACKEQRQFISLKLWFSFDKTIWAVSAV